MLRNHTPPDYSTAVNSLPDYLKKNSKRGASLAKRKKRGCKGGIRHRLKKLKNKLPLPTALLINAQSLRAKTDELSANTLYLQEYRSACVLVITETWLDSNIASSEVEPSGFSLFRTHRDSNINGKARGGSVCLLVRDEWCRAVVVREILCTPDIELLCVSQAFPLTQGISSNLHYRGIHTPKSEFQQGIRVYFSVVSFTNVMKVNVMNGITSGTDSFFSQFS